MINVNNIVDVRSIGYKALTDALGPVGFARFMQQYDNGTGDYTKEKYENGNDFEDWESIEAELKLFDTPEPMQQTM